ncbi:MAG TPA: hypothetical protein VGK33_17505, partial [Chloroflexota bacterium]
SDQQTVTISLSSNGRDLQYQGPNVSGGQETILQDLGGNNNEAGQAQGNSLDVASISQHGGSNNTAVQNQGLLSTQTGFMSVSGGVVVSHP